MRYITGRSVAATPDTQARRVVDIGERITWLRLHVADGAVTLLGYGLDATTAYGVAIAEDGTHEVPIPAGGQVDASDFHATGAGTIYYEALTL